MKPIAVAMLAVAVSVAGCGGDSEPESAPQTEIQVAAATASAEDVAAIERLFQYLSDANAAGQAEWLTAVAVSNFLVANGTYTPEACIAATRQDLGMLIGARFTSALKPDTVVSLAGRVQRVLGTIPDGNLYSVMVDVTIGPRGQSGPPATVTVRQDITVLPDGNAKTFFACA